MKFFRSSIVGWLIWIGLGFVTSASAQTAGPLTAQTPAIMSALQQITNVQMVVLTRYDTDTASFYYAAMQTLCSATNANWCDTDLYTQITDTTNPLGWFNILSYTDNNGNSQTICAILPPQLTLDPGYAATALSGGSIFDWRELATSDEVQAWLLMDYFGSCQDQLGDAQELATADAFASLTLTLMEGDYQFVANRDVSPARKFSYYRNAVSSGWAVNLGERNLLELWKPQAAALLGATPCTVTEVPSNNPNTPAIVLDSMFPVGQDCVASAGMPPTGTVQDSNLWLWTYPTWGMTPSWPTVGLPPQPFTPFMMFPSIGAAVNYTWANAGQIALQYPPNQ